VKAIWDRCEDCDDFVCAIHAVHVADCACPGIDAWAETPYWPYDDSPTDKIIDWVSNNAL